MSLAETETANVEQFRKPTRAGVPTQLQQFAKFGLTLNIVDFRQFCEELQAGGLGSSRTILPTCCFGG